MTKIKPRAILNAAKVDHTYTAHKNAKTRKLLGSFFKNYVCNYHMIAISLLGIHLRENACSHTHMLHKNYTQLFMF